MKRFLTVLALAAVAGAVYVAGATGRPLQTRTMSSTCACERQIKALQKDVRALRTQLTRVKQNASNALGFIENCFVGAVPVSRFGDATGGTYGYWYTPVGGTQGFTTALTVDSSATPGADLQAVAPECVTIYEIKHGATHSDSRRLPVRSERLP